MTSTPRRLALEAAVRALPSSVEGNWVVPEASLKAAGLEADPATARRYVVEFSAWAKGAIGSLPAVLSEECEATDFNDYYKLVMSRVQYVYMQSLEGAPAEGAPAEPLCQFQTQLRRRPVFLKGGVPRTLGVFDSGEHADYESCFEAHAAPFRAAVAAVGARRFSAATLRSLLAQRHERAAAIEECLAPTNDEWVAALDGHALFSLLPEGTEFSGGADCEAKIVVQGGQAVVLAHGPWFRITFSETSLLQCMSEFMTDAMCELGDADATAWCTEALATFALTTQQVHRKCAPNAFAFFSGRRAPSADFHLLQHVYFQHCWGNLSTSSLIAGRVLGGGGFPQTLVGTSAHEGPMAFMALHPELDVSLPVSSILWTLLFWGCTGNHTVLPDAYGSATFKHMLADLGLLGEVSMARQDSGRLDRFVLIYETCPRMASEIESFSDVQSGMDLGYVAFGAGGARKHAHGPQPEPGHSPSPAPVP